MPDTTQSAASILTETQAHIETRLSILKLSAVKGIAGAGKTVVLAMVLFAIASALLLTVSTAFALYLSTFFANKATGFFILGGFYGILFVLVFLFREKFVRQPLLRTFLKKFNS